MDLNTGLNIAPQAVSVNGQPVSNGLHLAPDESPPFGPFPRPGGRWREAPDEGTGSIAQLHSAISPAIPLSLTLPRRGREPAGLARSAGRGVSGLPGGQAAWLHLDLAQRPPRWGKLFDGRMSKRYDTDNSPSPLPKSCPRTTRLVPLSGPGGLVWAPVG